MTSIFKVESIDELEESRSLSLAEQSSRKVSKKGFSGFGL